MRRSAATISRSSCARPTCRRCPSRAPLFEIFVYHPQVEGIHLRGGHVARGGIRWSDRREDYRTEVLGLMKAQMVKNAVIVPVGAKGGFVLRNAAGRSRRAARRGAAALLDADPRHARRDRQHRRRRGRAARRACAPSTATTRTSSWPPTRARPRSRTRPTRSRSSTASGSATRSRRAVRRATTTRRSGITARGAWESVKRHFRELGRDVDARAVHASSASATCRATCSATACCCRARSSLIAAFDHRHVFLDPTPDPATSYAERARLFALGAGTSWQRLRPGGDLGRRRGVGAHREVGPALARGARGARHRGRRRSTPTSSSARSCARPSTCSGTAASARS